MNDRTIRPHRRRIAANTAMRLLEPGTPMGDWDLLIDYMSLVEPDARGAATSEGAGNGRGSCRR
jgi:hypothetical protein